MVKASFRSIRLAGLELAVRHDVNLSVGIDERLLVLEAFEELESLLHTLHNLQNCGCMFCMYECDAE